MATNVELAAKASPQKKVGPYIAEAVRQRLERDGMLPEDHHAEIIAAADEIGVEKALAILTRANRRKAA